MSKVLFSHARPRLIVIAALTMALLLASWAAACTGQSDVFSGRWEADAAPQALDGRPPVIAGWPTLALGHYGQEVAGVAYFFKPAGVELMSPCSCAFVNHRSLDLDARTVVFDTLCEPTGVRAMWQLEVTEDEGARFLVGTVALASGEEGGAVTVRLRFAQAFVTEEERQCPVEPR